jgi:hypothetical protein
MFPNGYNIVSGERRRCEKYPDGNKGGTAQTTFASAQDEAED